MKSMQPDLKISSFLMDRLQSVKQQCSGCLFGVFYGDGTLLLLGYNIESTIGKLNYKEIQYKFPAEVDLCGLVKFGDCSDSEAHLNDILKDVDITDNPILLNCDLGTLVGLRASIFMHGKLQEIPFSVLEPFQLYKEFCFTRLKCNLEIYATESLQDIQHQFNTLRKTVSSGILSFQIERSNVYATGSGVTTCSNKMESIKNNFTINDLINIVNQNLADEKLNSNDNSKKGNSQKDNNLCNIYGAIGSYFDILFINVLKCKTKDSYPLSANEDCKLNASPGISVRIKFDGEKICIPIKVEAMAMLSKSTKLHRLYDVLIESICRALRLLEHSMCEFSNVTNKLMVPKSYYFLPKEFGHFISCSYMIGLNDDSPSMQDKRKRLHRFFGLPLTRPYFRRSNRCVFRNEMYLFEPLLNIHTAIKTDQFIDGKQYYVQGDYFYYHYLQNQISDAGWGCAYRSIQTICSWFLLQGYTDRTIPLHIDIQKTLVNAGDKPKSFEGSKEWIGSTEVAIFLQNYLKVESKVKHVRSGSEMLMIVPDLISHFLTHGTPVMIGGGMLAHTIIGIDFNPQNNLAKFLILDPHYTGADDIQIILAKGWCGWKGIDFWSKDSYYNLCMPQKPQIF